MAFSAMLLQMAAANHRQTGALLRSLRRDKGWTHEDMSVEILKAYGVRFQTSARTIWRAEGGHKPSVRKQYAIASILGTTPSELWPEKQGRVAA